MSFKVRNILKFLVIILFIILLFTLKSNKQYIIIAFILLGISSLLIFKVRRDINLLFMFIPIFYANYSISVGEFINKNLQVSFNTIRFYSYEKYVDVLLMLCIFIIILFFFIKPNNNKNNFQNKDNLFIFYALAITVLFINIFFFDRSVSNSYIVRSNSLHGYTYLLVLFMSYYSGNKKARNYLILSIVGFTALQSLIFGGRLAIIPTVIIALVTIFFKKLNYKNVLIIAVLGVMLLTIIGQVRSTVELEYSNVLQLFKTDYFVQDTSVYAYNSSVTHVFSQNLFTGVQRMQSFFAFLISIFVGQNSDFTILGNVTLLSDSVVNNLGGGIISSYFYFWLGWFGVVLIPFIIVFTINTLNNSSKQLHRLILVGVVATSSTWYLYSPLQFFRIITIFIPLIYFVLNLLDRELKKMRG